MYSNFISTINVMFNSMFNTIFCKYKNTNIYKKSLVNIKVIERLIKLKILVHNFFKLCGNSGATCAPQINVSFLWYFFKEKKWLNRVSEVMLSYLQNLPIYYLSGKYKLSIRSLTEYCYTDVYSCAIFRAIQTFKKMFGAW